MSNPYGNSNSLVGATQATKTPEITDAMLALESKLEGLRVNFNELCERLVGITNPKFSSPTPTSGNNLTKRETPLAQSLQMSLEVVENIHERMLRLRDCIEL